MTDKTVKLGNYVKVNRVVQAAGDEIIFDVEIVHAPHAAVEHMRKVSPYEAVLLAMGQLRERESVPCGPVPRPRRATLTRDLDARPRRASSTRVIDA